MSELMRLHASWFNEWLDDAVASDPRRSGEKMVDRLVDNLHESFETGTPQAGGKIDLSNYFDRCDPRRSLRILRRHGMDVGLVKVLEVFHSQMEIHVEAAGVVAAEVIRPERGLLQGCPASVMLAIGEQDLWVKYMRWKVPDVVVGVYIDDRTLWANGPNAPARMQDAATPL